MRYGGSNDTCCQLSSVGNVSLSPPDNILLILFSLSSAEQTLMNAAQHQIINVNRNVSTQPVALLVSADKDTNLMTIRLRVKVSQ